MVAISPASAQARIRQILGISAQHFAIPSHPVRAAPLRYLIASEFKDPLPLRWMTSFTTRDVQGQCGVSA
jgi:hypothetical protein